MERGAATGRDDDQGARRIDALLGGLAGSARASLEEMLDDNDFWGGGDEEEGSRGQARRRTEQLGSELTPLIPAPGTDRSDGKGAATGLV